jgi:parallel beta helix pectate lyase-like protein
MNKTLSKTFLALACIAPITAQAATPDAHQLSVRSYPSIQEAIDRNPAKTLQVPSGDYEITQRIRITQDGSGLAGPGRIIQTNPAEPIIDVRNARDVQLRDLTLTRPQAKQDTFQEAVRLENCRDVRLANLRILDNRTKSGCIYILNCTATDVVDCRIRNYMRVAVDDRTRSANENRDWGYAFNCIDGTGIIVKGSSDTLLRGNRVVEEDLLPTPEVKQEFKLGQFVKRADRRGELVNETVWNKGYVNNWHQGSAILVSNQSQRTRILGNHVQNAGQGIDIHSDHVIVSNNIVDNAFMGIKAMHGSRNVIIANNQFSRNDLWAIGLMPGVASHPGISATADSPAQPPNVDGGSIISGNVISDFGYGSSYWIWGLPEDRRGSCFPIRLDNGQKPDDPPLTDVLVQGNIIYDTGKDQIVENGQLKPATPRYRYAVFIHPGENGPKNIKFTANIFNPGVDGVSNRELEE